MSVSRELARCCKQAKEFGEAEVWMNERMQRAAPYVCAEIITAFDERYRPGRLPQDRAIWIVWAYEGDFTLWDLMQVPDTANLDPCFEVLRGVLYYRFQACLDTIGCFDAAKGHNLWFTLKV